MAIKVGDSVRQIVPAPIAGTVTRKMYDEASDSFILLVESAEGETRWFNESQIEVAQ